MSTKTAAQRLGEAVRHRRETELDQTQLEVHAAGGPSNSTQTAIENGRLQGDLNRKTAQKLDRGLRWEPGSAMRVWRGEGEAVPVSGGTQDAGYVSSPGATTERTASEPDVLRAVDAMEAALRDLRQALTRPPDD